MGNNINLTTCDAFELTEIAHETLSAAGGYFYQMFIKEQKKEKVNVAMLQKYRTEHARIIAISLNSKDALLKDKLINQINEFSVYSMNLKELSLNENF